MKSEFVRRINSKELMYCDFIQNSGKIAIISGISIIAENISNNADSN